MRIREGDKWKTAFRTKYGHFKYQVIPFSLSNVTASFQGYINKILAERLDIFVMEYMDNILIYTKDPGQPYGDAVPCVLKQLQKHNFYATLKKCRFHEDEVRFLGFVVLAQGIKMEEERIEAVITWLELQSVKDTQMFLVSQTFTKGSSGTSIESQHYSPQCSEQLINQMAMSLRTSRLRIKLRQVLLVKLVVLELMEVSKICQLLYNHPSLKSQN